MSHANFSELGAQQGPYPIGPENFIGKVEVPKSSQLNIKRVLVEFGVSLD